MSDEKNHDLFDKLILELARDIQDDIEHKIKNGISIVRVTDKYRLAMEIIEPQDFFSGESNESKIDR